MEIQSSESTQSTGQAILAKAGDKAKKVTIDGKSYYLVVKEGEKYADVGEIDTAKINKLATVLLNAHKTAAPQGLDSREIDYIDSTGVHYRSGDVVNHDDTEDCVDAEKYLKATGDFEWQQEALDFETELANKQDTDTVDQVPQFLAGRYSTSNAGELKETLVKYTREKVLETDEVFVQAYSSEKQAKVRNIYKRQYGKMSTVADLVKASRDGIQATLTARHIWNTLLPLFQPRAMMLINPDSSDNSSESLSLRKDDNSTSLFSSFEESGSTSGKSESESSEEQHDLFELTSSENNSSSPLEQEQPLTTVGYESSSEGQDAGNIGNDSGAWYNSDVFESSEEEVSEKDAEKKTLDLQNVTLIPGPSKEVTVGNTTYKALEKDVSIAKTYKESSFLKGIPPQAPKGVYIKSNHPFPQTKSLSSFSRKNESKNKESPIALPTHPDVMLIPASTSNFSEEVETHPTINSEPPELQGIQEEKTENTENLRITKEESTKLAQSAADKLTQSKEAELTEKERRLFEYAAQSMDRGRPRFAMLDGTTKLPAIIQLLESYAIVGVDINSDDE